MFNNQAQLCAGMFSGLDDDGFPVIQVDAHGKNPGELPFPLHHTFGFASRPRDPDVDGKGQIIPGGACQVWKIDDGDELHGILSFDPRFVATFPQLKKGGSMQYSAPGSFVVMDGEDGTITEYIPVPGSKAHVLTRGLDGTGAPFIGIEHANGMSVTMLGQSLTIKNAAGDAYIELNDSGVVLNGNTKAVAGMLIGNVAAAVALTKAPTLIALLQTLAGFIDGKTGAPSTALVAVNAAAAGLGTLLLSGS